MTIINFGMAKDIIGVRELTIDANDIKTVAQLKSFLGERYIGLSQIKGYMIAINETYAESHELVQEHDTIAIIPPVSGG